MVTFHSYVKLPEGKSHRFSPRFSQGIGPMTRPQVLAVAPTLVTLAPLPRKRSARAGKWWDQRWEDMISQSWNPYLKFRGIPSFSDAKRWCISNFLGFPMRFTAVKNTWVDQLRFSQRSCSGRLSWCMEHPWKNGGRTASQLPNCHTCEAHWRWIALVLVGTLKHGLSWVAANMLKYQSVYVRVYLAMLLRVRDCFACCCRLMPDYPDMSEV